MFEFRYDPPSGVLHCKAKGFWDGAEAQAFATERAKQVARARSDAGRLRILCDAAEANVQS